MATQLQLDQAKSEYHNLITGVKARVVVDSNGERVEFTAANASRLKSYIDNLERELNLRARSGPMSVYF